MKFIRNKILLLLCFGFLLGGCRKVTLTSKNKVSNIFNQAGRVFVFPCTVFTGGKDVTVNIPAGSVSGNAYLEFYQYRLQDASSVDSFYVDGTAGDLNLILADKNPLQVPATISIPFYFSTVYTPSSGYKPYRVKADDYTDLVAVLNNADNWEEITNFTYDNSTQHLIFHTQELEGLYVVAKRK